VHRLSSPSPSLSNLSTDDDGASFVSSTSTGTASSSFYEAGSKEELKIEVGEVRTVKKEQKLLGRVEGLVVVTKGGEVRLFPLPLPLCSFYTTPCFCLPFRRESGR
jgi:hypothetical protein